MKKSSSTIVFLLYLVVLVGLGLLVISMRNDIFKKRDNKPQPTPSVVVAPKKSQKTGKIEVSLEKTSFQKDELVRFSFKNGTDEAVFITSQEAIISPKFFVINETDDRAPAPHCPTCAVIDPLPTKVNPGASSGYTWDQKTQEGIVEPGAYRIEIEYWTSENDAQGKGRI